MSITFIISQVFSALAFAMLVISFYNKKKSKMLAFQVADSLFDGIHFCLLGAFSGGIINFVGMLRSIVFLKKEKHSWLNSIYVFLLFIVLYILICLITYDGIISLLPTIGVIIFASALWFGTPKTIRFMGVIASVFWLSYDICVRSYVEITTEIILLISTMISMLKLDILKKRC